MTTSPRVAFALGLTLGLFVALGPSCSSGGTGGGTGGSGGSGGSGVGGGTATGGGSGSFCGDFANAYCDYGVRCGFVSPAARAECVTYISPLYCAASGGSIAKGYITLDNAKAGKCISSVIDAGCEVSIFSGPECSNISTSNQTTGQGCFNNSDCKSMSEGCGGASCMQTCQATGAQGQPCPRTTSCNTGLRCDSVTNTCIPPGGVGADCSFSGDCDATTYCDTTATPRKCVALPTGGQTCRTSFPQCTNGYYCATASNTCQAKLALNATCTSTSNCQDTLFCDFSKTPDSCQTRLGSGASCATTGFDSCQMGLRCISSTCQTPRAAGASCAQSNDCATGLGCDDVLRTCQAYVYDIGEGLTCTDDTRNCDDPYVCKGAVVNGSGGIGTVGMCAVPKVGDACATKFGFECPSGSFCNLAVDGGPGTCVAASMGSPCQYASNCLTGHYCEGGLCADKKAAGATCASDSQCKSPNSCVANPSTGAKACGLPPDVGQACAAMGTGCLFPNVCVNGTCVHGGKVGEKCLSSGQCLTGICETDAGICQAAGAVGASCKSAGECASLRCFKGKCEAPCP